MPCILNEIQELSSEALDVLVTLLNNKEKLNDSEYGYIVNPEDLKSFEFSDLAIKEVLESGLVLKTSTVRYYLSISETEIKDVSDPNVIHFLEGYEDSSIRFVIDSGTICGLSYLEYT